MIRNGERRGQTKVSDKPPYPMKWIIGNPTMRFSLISKRLILLIGSFLAGAAMTLRKISRSRFSVSMRCHKQNHVHLTLHRITKEECSMSGCGKRNKYVFPVFATVIFIAASLSLCLFKDSRERKRIEVTRAEMTRIPFDLSAYSSRIKDAWGRDLTIKVCGKSVVIRSHGGDVSSTNDDIVLMRVKTDDHSWIQELSYPDARGRCREFVEYE